MHSEVSLESYLTIGMDRGMDIRDVRCPGCGHLQFRYRPRPDTWIERKCRCKTLFRIVATEIKAIYE